MHITEEQIFQIKKQLQQEIEQFEQERMAVQAEQAKENKVEKLAELILRYDQIEGEIESRSQLFSLFSSPPGSLTSPFIKAELFSYFEEAETIGPEMVNFLVEDFHTQAKKEIESGEDDEVDLIQAQYKEYILPGKIIGEKFDELDALVREMINYCYSVDPNYDPEHEPNSAGQVLKYAFEISITADTRMEPTIEAIQNQQFMFLKGEHRLELLDKAQERISILRFDEAKKQNIAMEMAVQMLEEREG